MSEPGPLLPEYPEPGMTTVCCMVRLFADNYFHAVDRETRTAQYEFAVWPPASGPTPNVVYAVIESDLDVIYAPIIPTGDIRPGTGVYQRLTAGTGSVVLTIRRDSSRRPRLYFANRSAQGTEPPVVLITTQVLPAGAV